jgi:hypothetical protein
MARAASTAAAVDKSWRSREVCRLYCTSRKTAAQARSCWITIVDTALAGLFWAGGDGCPARAPQRARHSAAICAAVGSGIVFGVAVPPLCLLLSRRACIIAFRSEWFRGDMLRHGFGFGLGGQGTPG